MRTLSVLIIRKMGRCPFYCAQVKTSSVHIISWKL